jgi:hypothetical protein
MIESVDQRLPRRFHLMVTRIELVCPWVIAIMVILPWAPGIRNGLDALDLSECEQVSQDYGTGPT